MSAFGVKRTSLPHRKMSANDRKRTFAGLSLLTDTYLQVPIWTDPRRGCTIPAQEQSQRPGIPVAKGANGHA
jgi:hypothetical protein